MRTDMGREQLAATERAYDLRKLAQACRFYHQQLDAVARLPETEAALSIGRHFGDAHAFMNLALAISALLSDEGDESCAS